MDTIEVCNVSKKFGAELAVDQVSFQVSQGRIFGLLGPNGAGKTTMLRMINNILLPDGGTITIMGNNAGSETQSHIGYLPEERGLYKTMRVGEQLIYLARLKGLARSKAEHNVRYWLEQFNASDWYYKEIGELSKGMSQKIQFIAAIVHQPEIFILDEPFSGLDPLNNELLKEIIMEFRKNNKTILLSTHRMEQIEQLCDDICLFNNGNAVLTGNLRDIKKSYGKNTIYLEFDGDASFLETLEQVRINKKSTNYAEIRLLNNQDKQEILSTAMEHVEINKFEFSEPSLTEIFISVVGEDNLNPKTLK